MDESIEYEEVTLYSDGLKLAAHLWRPCEWTPRDPVRPAVVSLHGYTGMKHIYGMDVPRRLSQEGYWVLGLDHRGFGKSEGERGRMRPLEQAQDTYDAITYLETVEGVDSERIGVYGTSFGGANAIWVAAFDDRVKAVVSSVGVADGARWLQTVRRPHEWRSLLEQIDREARKRVRSGEPTWLPMNEALLSDPHTQQVWRDFDWSDDPLYIGEYDLESLEAALRYRPEWVADRISPRPALFIYAEHDGIVPPSEALSCYEACGEPKRLVKLPKAAHYESYHFVNPAMHELGMAATVEWYAEHL